MTCIGLALGAAACGKKDEAASGNTPTAPEATPPTTPPTAPEVKPPPQAAVTTAVARLEPRSGSEVSGTVTLTEREGKVEVKAEITGLTPGDHGFHIHEKGDCSAPDAASAGSHFNPAGVEHGLPGEETRHPGDLGNIKADDGGKASASITTDRITLGEGENSVAGLAVIVHEKADDGGQPVGNAGGRVACGIIAVQR